MTTDTDFARLKAQLISRTNAGETFEHVLATMPDWFARRVLEERAGDGMRFAEKRAERERKMGQRS